MRGAASRRYLPSHGRPCPSLVRLSSEPAHDPVPGPFVIRLSAHLALAFAGAAALVWALTLAAHPVIMCRDAVMGPGDVCPNAQGTQTQTYEQRFAISQQARPVVAGLGLLVGGFGVVLAVQDARGRGR